MARQNNFGQRLDWNERDFSANPLRDRGYQIPATSQSSSGPTPRPIPHRQGEHVNDTEPSHAGDGALNSTPRQIRHATPFLSTVDILGKFKLPETQPVFKVEPSEPDIMKLPLRSSRRPKNDRPSIYAIKPRKRPTGNASQDVSGRGKKDLNKGRGNAETNQGAHQQDPVVDLTADDDGEEEEEEERVRSPRQDNGSTVQRQDEIPHIGPFVPFNPTLNDRIPDMALQYVREQYRQDQIILPTNITNWQQLLEFASANTKPSLVTPGLVAQWRNSSRINSVPQPNIDPFSRQSSASIQNTIQSTSDRSLFHDQSTPFSPTPQAFAPTHDAYRAKSNSERALGTTKKPVHQAVTLSNTNTDRTFPRPSDSHPGTSSKSRPPKKNTTQEISDVAPFREAGNPLNHTVQAASTVNIDILMQPSEAFPDILPSSAPLGHPHLVSLWHPNLLKLPKTQHNHLDLIDTVISIMYKYDIKEQSVIKAFLDMDEVPHLFFLFKSRTNAWHSWSVERELNIVTVGLERNSRAANTAESTRPSSGQFDVTIQYKMDPPTPTGPALSDTATANIMASTDPAVKTVENPPAAQNGTNPSSTIENTQLSAPSPPPVQVTQTIPGLWHLQGTTLFPSQPSLYNFLWTTPPNRGADDVSRYYHPTQSHLLPSSDLSILARYLQHTAFTCSLMEAEFQVVWGRKVRYDSVLGRVRATYDHALKGAKTQAEKRKRGEYNRPIGKSGLSVVENAITDDGEKEESSSRPGAGEAMDFLSGKIPATAETENNSSTEPTGQDATSLAASLIAARAGSERTDRSLSERLRKAIPRTANPTATAANSYGRNRLTDITTLGYHPTTIKAERPRKRLKREQRDETSGSEYSDSGRGEE